MDSIIIDTSAWIESFRPDGEERLQEVVRHFIFQNRVLMPGLIKAELLRGVASLEDYKLLSTMLEGLIYLPVEEDFWNRVSDFSFELRSKGVEVPIVNAYIALLAIEQKVLLLHRDHNFDAIVENSALEVLRTFRKIKS